MSRRRALSAGRVRRVEVDGPERDRVGRQHHMASIAYLKIDWIARTHLELQFGVHRDEEVHRRADVGEINHRAA